MALFAEAEGFAHVHFHVVPRDPGLPDEYRGPRVFSLLGADPARRVPADTLDQLATAIGAVLPLPGAC